MNLRTSRFAFNTFITSVAQQDDHDRLVSPIVNSIFITDGIYQCLITREGIEVMWYDTMIDQDRVVEVVQQAIAWSVDGLTGVFPLRGDKTPTATLIQLAKIDDGLAWCTAHFGSNIVPLVPGDDGEVDVTAFYKSVNYLLEPLVKHGAVVNYVIAMQHVSLQYVVAQATDAEMRAHINTILQDVVKPNSGYAGYFRFRNGRPFVLTFDD